MLDNRLVIALIGGASVIAAGTGAFVATRMNGSSAETALVQETAPAQAPAAVTATEAIVEPLPETPGAAASEPLPNEPPRRSSLTAHEVEERPRPSARRASTPPRRQAPATSRPTPAQPPPPEPAAVPQAPETVLTENLPVNRPIEVQEPPVPRRTIEELVIPADSVIGLQIENTISTETAQVEDEVRANVTRDVMVGSRVAVPSGSRVVGHVTLVERGGKVKERARLGVRFHTLVLADGTTLPIQTETVYREGESPARSSTAKIGGGAAAGAVIGAILGGTKGAIIGGSTGAAGGTAAVMAGGRKPATLAGGSTVTVRVLSPISVNVEN
ncbi:MAG TPA: hypothetical protein VNK41_12055 [Vicinamibacterales bacterium]|nr:hypothetical protein [Vicinamibacterales bacterium]